MDITDWSKHMYPGTILGAFHLCVFIHEYDNSVDKDLFDWNDIKVPDI